MLVRFETDPELSLRGKGLLIVCKELIARGINPNVANIKPFGLDAERSITSGLHELTHLGYYKATKYRLADRRGFDWKFEVSETREIPDEAVN